MGRVDPSTQANREFESTRWSLVLTAAHGPDGKKLVTRGYFSQATIRIWDASEGYAEAQGS